MINVSEIKTDKPNTFKTELHSMVYDTLERLEIPFERVDTDEAITMEDCVEIGKKLDTAIVKTLFLCNRQKTNFYLFVTTDEKPFVTKDFSRVLGISRVSFASPEMLFDMLGTRVGSATALSCIFDKENKVKIVLDKDAVSGEWYGCSDGTTTGYMKLKTEDLIKNYLPFANHIPTIIEI
ncbi:MAG: prolyl-tRNA synthetase associated domain-containing protein [Eubacterium sp.]|nr:prolyl-tRNA synthetase associated domain-containing protein [Eubacterium sp.]